MGLEDNWQKAQKRADTEDIESHRKDRLNDLANANGISFDDLYTIKNTPSAEGARFGTMVGTINGVEIVAGGPHPTIDGRAIDTDKSALLFNLLQRVMGERNLIDGIAEDLTQQEIAKTAELYNNPETRAEWAGTTYEGHTLGSLVKEF